MKGDTTTVVICLAGLGAGLYFLSKQKDTSGLLNVGAQMISEKIQTVVPSVEKVTERFTTSITKITEPFETFTTSVTSSGQALKEAGEKITDIPKDIVISLEDSGKRVIDDVTKVFEKATETAVHLTARGLPLGVVGAIFGGPYGAIAGAVSGHVLYETGKKIGDVTYEAIGKPLIEMTGGMQSSLVSLGNAIASLMG